MRDVTDVTAGAVMLVNEVDLLENVESEEAVTVEVETDVEVGNGIAVVFESDDAMVFRSEKVAVF